MGKELYEERKQRFANDLIHPDETIQPQPVTRTKTSKQSESLRMPTLRRIKQDKDENIKTFVDYGGMQQCYVLDKDYYKNKQIKNIIQYEKEFKSQQKQG